jgi:hypothetical protein
MHLDIFGQTPNGLDLRITSPKQLTQLLTTVGLTSSNVQVLDTNIQASIDAERQRLATKDREAAGKKDRQADYFSDYHKYEEIKQFCVDLSTAYPKLVTFVPSIGKSVEGRDIFQLRITGNGGSSTSKPHLWLNSLQHAREWIGGATTQYIANHLASNYGKDPRVTKLVDTVEWVITPIVNPDGYHTTWTTDRMQRKNKHEVDLNRNYPYMWGRDDGSSSDPSDEDYRGPAPASEPEVQAIVKSFKETPNLAGSIDFHSYAEAVLRPWGWGNQLTQDESKFVELANKMIASVKATTKRGSNFRSLTKLYPVSGSIRDYFYSNNATADGATRVYSYTVELSPNSNSGGNGFILPPSEIVKVGAEWATTALIFAEHVTQNRLGPKTL